jgi:hypothetical protein
MTVILPDVERSSATGFRWSSVRSCARKSVYERIGAPKRERSRTEQGYLWRGKQLGRDFAIILASDERKKGRPYRIKVASGLVGDWPRRWVTSDIEKAGFVVEEAIRWPLGVLHPDIRIVATNTIVEVLSSTHGEQQVAAKMLQLVGQMHYANVDAGAVVVVNPSNPLDYDIHPIARTSRTYAELVEEVELRVAAILEWRDGGPLPERVCAQPNEARKHFCLHAEHCFAGWEPPDPEVVLDTNEAHLAAAELYVAKREEHAVKLGYDAAVARRRQAEQDVAELFEDAGDPANARIGTIDIRRIVVADRETFSLAKARTAGAWSPLDDETFAPFLKRGGGHTRWMVDRADGVPFEPSESVD